LGALSVAIVVVWIVTFFAGCNFVRNSELAPEPDPDLGRFLESAALPLLLVAGAVLPRRLWLVAALPPPAIIAVLLALDEPPNTWLPSSLTTLGWILLPILPILTIAIGGTITWPLRRWMSRRSRQ